MFSKEIAATIPSAFNAEQKEYMQMLDMLKTAEFHHALIYLHGKVTDPQERCWAVPAYQDALMKAISTGQNFLNDINEVAKKYLDDMDEALQYFEYAKLDAMARCEKEDCPDRDEARKELGWTGDTPTLL